MVQEYNFSIKVSKNAQTVSHQGNLWLFVRCEFSICVKNKQRIFECLYMCVFIKLQNDLIQIVQKYEPWHEVHTQK